MIAQVTAQGEVFELRPLVRYAGARGGGLRSVVKGFSAASRRRLMDVFARLDIAGVRCSFVTLTFAGTPTPAQAKAAWRRFAERIKRRAPGVSAVWRMERQERSSIHFHVLAFRLPYIPQAELQRIWEACTREPMSIVHIKLLHTKRAVTNYCAKYVSKKEAQNGPPSLDDVTYPHAVHEENDGRVWGFLNRTLLPVAECYTAVIEGEGEIGYCRWACGALSRGKATRYRAGAKLYSNAAVDIFRHLLQYAERATVDEFDLWAEMRFSQRHE